MVTLEKASIGSLDALDTLLGEIAR